MLINTSGKNGYTYRRPGEGWQTTNQMGEFENIVERRGTKIYNVRVGTKRTDGKDPPDTMVTDKIGGEYEPSCQLPFRSRNFVFSCFFRLNFFFFLLSFRVFRFSQHFRSFSVLFCHFWPLFSTVFFFPPFFQSFSFFSTRFFFKK